MKTYKGLRLWRQPVEGPLVHKLKARDWRAIDQPLRFTINQLVTAKLAWPLFLHGPVRKGKTCAMLCLADCVGGSCRYVTLDELCEAIISAGHGELYDSSLCPGHHKGTVERIWRSWREASLTILDEIGTRIEVKDFPYMTLLRALNEREGNCAAFVSNKTLDELEGLYDKRVAERLSEGTVFFLDPEDQRRQP